MNRSKAAIPRTLFVVIALLGLLSACAGQKGPQGPRYTACTSTKECASQAASQLKVALWTPTDPNWLLAQGEVRNPPPAVHSPEESLADFVYRSRDGSRSIQVVVYRAELRCPKNAVEHFIRTQHGRLYCYIQGKVVKALRFSDGVLVYGVATMGPHTNNYPRNWAATFVDSFRAP